jgi:hypothetical protein
MHSLIGSFVIDTLNIEAEMVIGHLHRKLEIKISEFFKRIFFIPCKNIKNENINGSGEYQFGHASGTIGRMMGHESMQ